MYNRIKKKLNVDYGYIDITDWRFELWDTTNRLAFVTQFDNKLKALGLDDKLFFLSTTLEYDTKLVITVKPKGDEQIVFSRTLGLISNDKGLYILHNKKVIPLIEGVQELIKELGNWMNTFFVLDDFNCEEIIYLGKLATYHGSKLDKLTENYRVRLTLMGRTFYITKRVNKFANKVKYNVEDVSISKTIATYTLEELINELGVYV